MLKLILAVSIIGYCILISFIFEVLKEIQTIRKILWKIAPDECFNFFFKNSKKNSKEPINRS